MQSIVWWSWLRIAIFQRLISQWNIVSDVVTPRLGSPGLNDPIRVVLRYGGGKVLDPLLVFSGHRSVGLLVAVALLQTSV